MPFLREGIENVRAVFLPDAIAADGGRAAFSRTALVTWKSCLEDVLYQAYLNGCFAGATVDSQQRQLVIQIPSSFEAAVRVEVVAVEPTDAHLDFAHEIGYSAVCSARVKLTLLRSQTLPAAAVANIYFDNGTGGIDYSTPLNDAPIPLWPCWQDKAGFGLAQFGTGDFGYDAPAAIGFGKGVFGRGQFGLDADTIEWISPALPLGAYRFGVKVVDAQGNESLASETGPISIIPAARPASQLDVVTFDEQTNELTLSVSD
jgi:hypothetical protein